MRRRHSNCSIECGFDIGAIEGQEYTVTIDHFTRGAPETRDEPEDGPEIEWKNFVEVSINGEGVGFVPWDVFQLEYAASFQVSMSVASSKIEDTLYAKFGDYSHDDDDCFYDRSDR